MNLQYIAPAFLIFIFVASTVQGQQPANGGGFVPLFNGKTLDGWVGDAAHWRVESGTVIGKVTPAAPLKTNTFLVWKNGVNEDFELVTEYRTTTAGNSGINYRSELLADVPNALKGYQADIDGADEYTGQNYEERGRGFLAMRGQQVTMEAGKKPLVVKALGDAASLKASIRKNDWNELRIIAKGNRLQHYINGVLMSDVTDNDQQARKMSGRLGLQVHAGPPMRVEYRNMKYRKR